MRQMSLQLNRDRLRKPVALLLFALLVLSLMVLAHPAFAITEGQVSSFVVQFATQDYLEDLQTAHVVYDLYRVGTAPAGPGQPWKLLPPYGDDEVYTTMTNAERLRLSRALGKIALESGEAVIRGGVPGQNYYSDDAGQPLLTGLYVMITHGSDLNNYAVYTDDELAPGLQATSACSELWDYSFAPEFIFLSEGTTILSLKASRNERFGDLEIIKDLLRFESESEAIFVYDITATRNGVVVYTNVASITWPETRALIKNIPGGSTVTVTEIYTGAQYQLVSAPQQTALIQASVLASVNFTNDYDGTGVGGGGIENSFRYVEDDQGGQNGGHWVWNGEGGTP